MRTRFEIIQEVLTEIFGCSSGDIITTTTKLSDFGADSLDQIEFVMALEGAMDITLEDSEVEPLAELPVGAWLKALDDILGPEQPTDGLLTLTDSQFIRRYDPEKTEQGDYYRQREWFDKEDVGVIKLAIAENRCWTMVDGDDGAPCIDWGNRVVNRLYNIVTRKPIEDPDWIVQVPDDDWDREEEEDEDE